uniref:Transthyretin-like family protein n=1 Tax=Romanomermis culicivorax TaxID=13658 RepID=A0A915L558_ROMCU
MFKKSRGLISQTTVGQTTTGSDGSFKIDATFSSAKPVLKIYHKCNRGALSCYMEYSYKVPSNFVSKPDQLIRPLSFNRELSNHTEDEKENSSNAGQIWGRIHKKAKVYKPVYRPKLGKNDQKFKDFVLIVEI